MKTLYIFLFLFNIIYALPLFPSSSSSIEQPQLIYQQQEQILEQQQEKLEEEESIIEEEDSKCPTTEYSIPVERFAQLVSTHWQFDHLDSIRSGTYKVISTQFQEHIRIHIEPFTDKVQIEEQQHQNYRQKSLKSTLSNTWDMMMDLEILHAQIFGALQAHTEGSLHIAWDRLSDKIGQPAFEQFIRTIALQYCTLDEEQMTLSSTCLKDKANLISKELDEYIDMNLNQIFVTLEKEVLPNLLSNTSQDLKGVLDYFNRLFLLKDNQHLILEVSPWSEQGSNLQQQLQPLLHKSIDEHLQDFFENYSCFSRA